MRIRQIADHLRRVDLNRKNRLNPPPPPIDDPLPVVYCRAGCRCAKCNAERINRMLWNAWTSRSRNGVGHSRDYGRVDATDKRGNTLVDEDGRVIRLPADLPDLAAGLIEAHEALSDWLLTLDPPIHYEDLKAFALAREHPPLSRNLPDRCGKQVTETLVRDIAEHAPAAVDATIDGRPKTLPTTDDVHLKAIALAMANVPLSPAPRAGVIQRSIERGFDDLPASVDLIELGRRLAEQSFDGLTQIGIWRLVKEAARGMSDFTH